jgi:hypothetical protein
LLNFLPITFVPCSSLYFVYYFIPGSIQSLRTVKQGRKTILVLIYTSALWNCMNRYSYSNCTPTIRMFNSLSQPYGQLCPAIKCLIRFMILKIRLRTYNSAASHGISSCNQSRKLPSWPRNSQAKNYSCLIRCDNIS